MLSIRTNLKNFRVVNSYITATENIFINAIHLCRARAPKCLVQGHCYERPLLNPLPHMPSLVSSNSAANKDMMSKISTNGDTIF